jgi:hypothetical protein
MSLKKRLDKISNKVKKDDLTPAERERLQLLDKIVEEQGVDGLDGWMFGEWLDLSWKEVKHLPEVEWSPEEEAEFWGEV